MTSAGFYKPGSISCHNLYDHWNFEAFSQKAGLTESWAKRWTSSSSTTLTALVGCWVERTGDGRVPFPPKVSIQWRRTPTELLMTVLRSSLRPVPFLALVWRD